MLAFATFLVSQLVTGGIKICRPNCVVCVQKFRNRLQVMMRNYFWFFRWLAGSGRARAAADVGWLDGLKHINASTAKSVV